MVEASGAATGTEHASEASGEPEATPTRYGEACVSSMSIALPRVPDGMAANVGDRPCTMNHRWPIASSAPVTAPAVRQDWSCAWHSGETGIAVAARTESTAPSAPPPERAKRSQVLLRARDLESLLAQDDRARLVWAFVTGLDLSDFYARIGSREGGAGRAAIDPAVLLCLWLYATVEGVGSARAIARLSQAHDAYRWICGGITVHHDTLSTFRNERPAEINALLSQIVGTLLDEGLVSLDRVA